MTHSGDAGQSEASELLANLRDNPVCSVQFDAEVPCLTVIWKRPATSAQLRFVSERLLELIRQHKVSKVLGDDTALPLIEDDDQGWTDGLPVVPPVVDRVKAMLAADSRPADTVIARHPATGLDLSLHAAAVNAVMAGCLPDYFPVLVAAFEAMDKPEFNFHGSTASTGGSAPLLMVTGPNS